MQRTARLLLAAAARAAGPTAASPGPSATLPWPRFASALTSSPPPETSPSASAAAASAATSSPLVWPPPPEAFCEGGALDGLRKTLTGEEEERSEGGAAAAASPLPLPSSTRPAGQAGRALVSRPPPPTATPLLRRPYARIISAAEVASILTAAACDDVTSLDGLDTQAGCTFTEAMVFATARSTRHAAMATQALVHDLKQRIAASTVPVPLNPVVEGYPASDAWRLVDAGSVIAHVFVGADVRAAYDVESLWRTGGGGDRELEWEEEGGEGGGAEGEAAGPWLEK